MLKLILQALVLYFVIMTVPKQKLDNQDIMYTTLLSIIGLLLLDYLFSKVFRPVRRQEQIPM